MNLNVNDFNNDLTIIKQNINNADNINDIINIKNNIQNTIYLYSNFTNELHKLIELLDSKLKYTCNHQWIRDYTYYGEHSQYQCSICKIYK